MPGFATKDEPFNGIICECSFACIWMVVRVGDGQGNTAVPGGAVQGEPRAVGEAAEGDPQGGDGPRVRGRRQGAAGEGTGSCVRVPFVSKSLGGGLRFPLQYRDLPPPEPELYWGTENGAIHPTAWHCSLARCKKN